MANIFHYWENDNPENTSTYRVCALCRAEVAEGWVHPDTGAAVCPRCKADLTASNDTP